MNKGISIARGDYIARMDSDDIAMPERLKEQIKFMDCNPDVGVCERDRRAGDVNPRFLEVSET